MSPDDGGNSSGVGRGRDELRIGMSRTDTDDRQLALNTVRWLAGLL